MAIIKIPSANMYDLKNSVISKNAIDKIEINANKVSIQIDSDNLSYNEVVVTPSERIGNYQIVNGSYPKQSTSKKWDTRTYNVINGSIVSAAYSRLLEYSEMRLGYLTIPIKVYVDVFNDKYITKMYDGYNDEDMPNIDYSSKYAHYYQSANGKWQYSDTTSKTPSQSDIVNFSIGELVNYEITDGKIIDDRLTNSDSQYVSYDAILDENNRPSLNEYNIVYHYTFSETFRPSNATSDITLSVANKISIKDDTDVIIPKFTKQRDENGEYFAISITLLCSRQIVTLINNDYRISYNSIGNMPGTHDMSGAVFFDIANEITITLHGETKILNVKDILKVIGNNDGKNVLSISNNELIQTDNTLFEENFNKIYQQYKNGKETATLRCSINDYYDLDGNKVIDIKNSNKMCFEVGDEVIPYVYTAYGTDKPMSVDKQGKAKVFRVLGVRTFFDGAVWQELTLQEKS